MRLGSVAALGLAATVVAACSGLRSTPESTPAVDGLTCGQWVALGPELAEFTVDGTARARTRSELARSLSGVMATTHVGTEPVTAGELPGADEIDLAATLPPVPDWLVLTVDDWEIDGFNRAVTWALVVTDDAVTDAPFGTRDAAGWWVLAGARRMQCGE